VFFNKYVYYNWSELVKTHGGGVKGKRILILNLFFCIFGKHRYFEIYYQNHNKQFFTIEKECFYCGKQKLQFKIKQKGYNLIMRDIPKKRKNPLKDSFSDEELKEFRNDLRSINKEVKKIGPKKDLHPRIKNMISGEKNE
jgi:hypothetical protein